MMPPALGRAARISSCDRYRYLLVRVWDSSRHRLPVCMLNPSNADAEQDDPTIQTLGHFANAWGFGGIEVINLRAWRTSRPKQLLADTRARLDTMGPANRDAWAGIRGYARMNNLPILVAWGASAFPADVSRFFAEMFGRVPFICLGTTTQGFPLHPMARGLHRIPRDRQPIPFDPELHP